MSNINIGVIGTANIADRYVIPTILELSDRYNLKGIAGRSKTKAELFANKFNTSPYNHYLDLIKDNSIQAVYIPLPNSLHYDWIKLALQNGKHVLVEKSMACTLSHVIELNQLAEDENLVLMENFQFRFHKQLTLIKKILADGTIGDLRQVRSAFGFPPFPDSNNIRYKRELGGGSLLDAGAYPLKVSQEIINEPLFVDSASLYTDSNLNVDIWGSAQLKSRVSKITSQISFGFDNAYKCELEIWGSKGSIKANRIFTAPPGFKAEIIVNNSESEEKILLPPDNHFANMLNKFYSYIVHSDSCENEYISNVAQAKLINELRELAKA